MEGEFTMRTLIAIAAACTVAAATHAAVVEETISYTDGEIEMAGLLAYDDAIDGPRPAVLVVHEWYGNNEYSHERARMLAELGYTAFAVDMYGEGLVVDTPEAAREQVMQVLPDREVIQSRFNAAREWLAAHETADESRMAAIGYCFGGAVLLELARGGIDLAGVVSFHGSLSTGAPAEQGAVNTRILVCHGASDPMIGPEAVAGFMEEMMEARADIQFIAYPEALHSFTNPDADNPEGGSQYHAEADARSWEALQAFLDDIFEE